MPKPASPTALPGARTERVRALGALLRYFVPAPPAWQHTGTGGPVASNGAALLGLSPCTDYRTLRMAWKKALKWTDGLDHALTTMLACVASTKALGDQLWVKVIGPASCGKSTLCEAISTHPKYVLAKSTIRGFHSGFRTTNDEREDNSLVALVKDRTLVTKDGDTLLQSPNLPQILAEARDLYDSTSRTHYRNATSKDYSGIRMTWILCGTSSLRAIDSSELGERFLDCVIMEGIDPELEDEVLLRMAHRAERNLGLSTEGNGDTANYDPELTSAMSLTGGYVAWLRENVGLLGGIVMGHEAKQACINLGKFVAYMRARPSLRQEETAEREFAARLVSQLVRLAKCLALVLNRAEVDALVLERVRRVALDTARGQTLEIASLLHEHGEGLGSGAIATHLCKQPTKILDMLRFLRAIGVLELHTVKRAKGLNGKQTWRLTRSMLRLYESVYVE